MPANLQCCLDGCENLQAGALGTAVTNPIDLTDEIGGLILDLGQMETHYVWYEHYTDGMASMFFDKQVSHWENGEAYIKFTLKKRMGSEKVQVTQRDGRCVLHWYEQVLGTHSTTVSADAAIGDTTINLTSSASIGGLNPGVRLRMYASDGKIILAEVASVNPADANEITLTAPLTSAVTSGTCVERGAYNPAVDECEPNVSDNVNHRSNKKEYFSRFRYLFKTLEYSGDCLINGTYLADFLKAGDKQSKLDVVSRILKTEYVQQFEALMQEFIETAIFDNNTYAGQPAGDQYTGSPAGGNGDQTMGLLPQLKNVEVTTGKQQFFDLSTCCVAGDCKSPKKLINAFMDIVIARAKIKGAYKSRKVMVWVNDKQIEALAKMRPYMEAYNNYVITREARDEDKIRTNIRTFSISHMGYEIDFVHGDIFDRVKVPVAIVMPEDAMGVFVKERRAVIGFTGDGTPMYSQHDAINASGDTFKVNLDKKRQNWEGFSKCSYFLMWVEYAIAWMYTDKCAYAYIQNFTLDCLEDNCFDCSDFNPATPVDVVVQ